MPDTNKIQYRKDRNQGRIGISKAGIQASYGRHPGYLRVEYFDKAVILTDPRDSSYRERVREQ